MSRGDFHGRFFSTALLVRDGGFGYSPAQWTREDTMAAPDCIFCKIASGEIPSAKLYEDDEMVAFDDIDPKAPVHFLVVPKEHIPTMDDLGEVHASVVGKMVLVCAQIAREKGIAEDGYRQVINCRSNGRQEVFHLHMHILGGRKMRFMG
jgi:histidine triad (HIT) family protein